MSHSIWKRNDLHISLPRMGNASANSLGSLYRRDLLGTAAPVFHSPSSVQIACTKALLQVMEHHARSPQQSLAVGLFSRIDGSRLP